MAKTATLYKPDWAIPDGVYPKRLHECFIQKRQDFFMIIKVLANGTAVSCG